MAIFGASYGHGHNQACFLILSSYNRKCENSSLLFYFLVKQLYSFFLLWNVFDYTNPKAYQRSHLHLARADPVLLKLFVWKGYSNFVRSTGFSLHWCERRLSQRGKDIQLKTHCSHLPKQIKVLVLNYPTKLLKCIFVNETFCIEVVQTILVSRQYRTNSIKQSRDTNTELPKSKFKWMPNI